MFKKGQAALEFLTTYGWAFLVILVMIGALAYFGVLNPSRFVPDTCLIASGFQCDDHVVNTNSVILRMKNNIDAIQISNLSLRDLDTGVTYDPQTQGEWAALFNSGCTVHASGGQANCTAGEVFEIQFETAAVSGTFPTFTAGTKKKLSLHIDYFEITSGPTFARSTGGDIVGTVQ